MQKLRVCEIFQSINGEGRRAGQLAVFIRLNICNLNCSYCDTRWANTEISSYTEMTIDEIYNYIKETKIRNVTLTGGEPLLHNGVKELLEKLCSDENLSVEIETNGSIDVAFINNISPNRPLLTMDYKLPSSGMESHMNVVNFQFLQDCDTVKFVCGSSEDLKKAEQIIMQYHLLERCSIYLSPVFGKIDPKEMVEFMLERNLNGVNLQLQLHKFIWDPNQKGV